MSPVKIGFKGARIRFSIVAIVYGDTVIQLSLLVDRWWVGWLARLHCYVRKIIIIQLDRGRGPVFCWSVRTSW